MKKMSTLTIISLVLIGVGGVGAILLTVSQSISSSKDKEEINRITVEQKEDLETRLKEMQNERDRLSKSLSIRDKNIREQNQSILSLTGTLKEQSDKLQQQSEQIQNYVTGGDGYPIIIPKLFEGNVVDKFSFEMKNHFDFPLYNMKLRIDDEIKLKTKNLKKRDRMQFTLNPVI